MMSFIRRLKCLLGYHEWEPSIGLQVRYRRGSSWQSNKRSHWHWRETCKIKYYYCIHCHKRISVSEYKEKNYGRTLSPQEI